MCNFSKTFETPCSPSLKAITAEATAVSSTVFPTKTRVGHRFQTILCNDSLAFLSCLSEKTLFHSSFPKSARENIGFKSATTAAEIAIITLYVFFPVNWSRWYLYHDSFVRRQHWCWNAWLAISEQFNNNARMQAISFFMLWRFPMFCHNSLKSIDSLVR